MEYFFNPPFLYCFALICITLSVSLKPHPVLSYFLYYLPSFHNDPDSMLSFLVMLAFMLQICSIQRHLHLLPISPPFLEGVQYFFLFHVVFVFLLRTHTLPSSTSAVHSVTLIKKVRHLIERVNPTTTTTTVEDTTQPLWLPAITTFLGRCCIFVYRFYSRSGMSSMMLLECL